MPGWMVTKEKEILTGWPGRDGKDAVSVMNDRHGNELTCISLRCEITVRVEIGSKPSFGPPIQHPPPHPHTQHAF